MGQDTIFALSSGALPSGVAIIRISGPAARGVEVELLGDSLPARVACLRKLKSSDGGLLDEVIALCFPAPASFTGEDVVELHCHGGLATIDAVLSELGQRHGFRPAEAGEFSRRAFENGRLDLTELEGLSDLIAAQTDSQRVQALQQSSGVQRRLYESWRKSLIELRAAIEAGIDFADEGDVPDNVAEDVYGGIVELRKQIHDHLSQNSHGEIVRDGFRVALCGPVNAGKSSLLNALAKRDVAIVTPEAGTTRDVLTVSLNINGMLVHFSDTAGLRDAKNPVEIEGVRRARDVADAANLVIWLKPPEGPGPFGGLEKSVTVHSKSDLLESVPQDTIAISTKTGAGLNELIGLVDRQVKSSAGLAESTPITRTRHRHLLTETQKWLDNCQSDSRPEVASENLRLAGLELGRIVGAIEPDHLLDEIFSEFCIGK